MMERLRQQSLGGSPLRVRNGLRKACRSRCLHFVLALSLMVACERAPTPTATPMVSRTPTPSPGVHATLLPIKLVDREQATPGDVLQYTLVIMNDMISSDDPGTAVRLVDQLPDALEFVQGSLSSGASYDSAARAVQWSGQVPQGGSVQVVFEARLGSAALNAGSVVNTIMVTDAFGRRGDASVQTQVLRPTSSATHTPIPATATPVPPTATPAPEPRPTATEVQWPQASVPYVTCLVVTPDDPPVYYVVADFALYSSTDRGSTWAAEELAGVAGGSRVTSVAVDYRQPQTMYLATGEGLFWREGRDEPWGLVNTIRLTSLAVDLVNPDVLWAGTGWDTAMRSVIVKSDDRGRTWSKADFGVEVGYQTAWVGAILIDPNDPNVIWAHVRPGIRHGWPRGYVYRGGRAGTWERLPLGDFDFVGGPDPFGGLNDDVCFVSGLAYDPNLNALYAGCDISYFNDQNRSYRLLRSLNADAPNSAEVHWEVRAEFGQAAVYGVNSVRPLAVDARDPKSLFVFLDLTAESGPPSFALLASHDDGASWQEMTLDGLPGG
jgi:uncharacterized repeat protein (TIGR01451 family)